MKPYNEDQRPKGEQVRDMFNGIAPVYDLLNDVLSLGIARHWRRLVVRRVAAHIVDAQGVMAEHIVDTHTAEVMVERHTPAESPRILDLATGTGDLALALARRLPSAHITAADPSEGMLALARKKAEGSVLGEKRSDSNFDEPSAGGGRHEQSECESPAAWGGGVLRGSLRSPHPIDFVVSSAEQLPFENALFDAVTVSFGVRNFSDIEVALREVKRVLKPGGALFVLEFSTPRNRLWGAVYRFYFHKILPRIGALLSRDGRAYTYLPSSVDEFPAPARFTRMLSDAGFDTPTARPLTGGVAYIYSASTLYAHRIAIVANNNCCYDHESNIGYALKNGDD